MRLALRYNHAHRAEPLLDSEIEPRALQRAAAEVSEMTLVPVALVLRLIEDELDAQPLAGHAARTEQKTAPDFDHIPVE